MKKFSRRNFLKNAGYATCGGAVHSLGSPFLNQFGAYSFAQAAPGLLGASSVVIYLNFQGGMPLNICPMTDGDWNDRMEELAYPDSRRYLDQGVALHPSLSGLEQIWNEGKLAIINNVGYRSEARGVGINRSHAGSTRIVFGGRPDVSTVSEGWAVRYTNQLNSAFSGVSVGGSNFLVENGSNLRSFGDIADLGETLFNRGSSDSKRQEKFWTQVRNNILTLGEKEKFGKLPIVSAANNNIDATIATLQQQTDPDLNPLPLPNLFGDSGFQRQCEQVAQIMLAVALGVRFFFLSRGGTDTHSGEVDRFSSILDDWNEGVLALWENLKAMNRLDDVVFVCTSEFGRTDKNAAAGTDHGHSAPVLVFGGRVAGGIKTPAPTAADWAGRSYLYNVAVEYPALLANIMQAIGVDSNQIFPGYAPAPIQLFA